MSLVAFTFGSLGDIITLIQLSGQLVQFLAGASFNSGPYCDLILQVQHLNVLLTKLDALVAISHSPSMSGGVTETEEAVVLKCRKVLENIKQRASLYAARLQSKGVSWAKMGAMLFKESELVKFKEELQSANNMVINSMASITTEIQLLQDKRAQEAESYRSTMSSNMTVLLRVVQGIDQRIPQAVSQFSGAHLVGSPGRWARLSFDCGWFHEAPILVRQVYRIPRHLFPDLQRMVDFFTNMSTSIAHLPKTDRTTLLSQQCPFESLEYSTDDSDGEEEESAQTEEQEQREDDSEAEYEDGNRTWDYGGQDEGHEQYMEEQYENEKETGDTSEEIADWDDQQRLEDIPQDEAECAADEDARDLGDKEPMCLTFYPYHNFAHDGLVLAPSGFRRDEEASGMTRVLYGLKGSVTMINLVLEEGDVWIYYTAYKDLRKSPSQSGLIWPASFPVPSDL